MSVETDASSANQEPRKSNTHLTPDFEVKHEEVLTIVQDKDSEQFIERQQFFQAPFEYARGGSLPGLVLIFNQESFEDKTYRLGSRRDVNEIIICMTRLGFNVNEKHIFTDYKKNDIFSALNKILSQDLSSFNSLVLFFLSHGDNFNILHAHDLSLRANEIWQMFEKCKSLENKPKMFIFQACKGDETSTISSETTKSFELVPDSTFHSGYIGPDMLIVYSTTEGNVSFRDPKSGTWFIQELCKNFLSYGRRDDVVSLIMRTGKCLGRNYYYHDKEQIKKQMPVLVSTLRKKFYLNRSKERNVLNKLVLDQQTMAKKIKDLEIKVEELLQEKEKKSK